MKRYAELNKLEIRIAVFFSSLGIWTLLRIDHFDENEMRYSIQIDKAMACSEMAILGDCMIGTTPDLELHLLTDENEASEIDDAGNVIFTTRDVKLYCAGQEITNDEEKKIAFHLIQFGTWIEAASEPIIYDNKLHGIKFIYTPEHKDEENFAIIGHLSTMVANGFREHTIKDGNVIALKLGLDPSVFKVLIPENYKGERLPLWRFIIEANPEFKNS